MGFFWFGSTVGIRRAYNLRANRAATAMNSSPSPAFSPSPQQRRWVRGCHAAIWGQQWIHFVRVDRSEEWMVEAPYDHNDCGVWRRQCRSVWQCPSVGAEFDSIDAAARWVEAMPSC